MIRRLWILFFALTIAFSGFASAADKQSQPDEHVQPEEAESGPDRFEPTNPEERKKHEREIAERVRKILAGVEGRESASGAGSSGSAGSATLGDK